MGLKPDPAQLLMSIARAWQSSLRTIRAVSSNQHSLLEASRSLSGISAVVKFLFREDLLKSRPLLEKVQKSLLLRLTFELVA